MRFLRMLTNSLVAGALGAAFLTILVLQLNPSVPLVSSTTWHLFAVLALFYGVHLAVLFYVLMHPGPMNRGVEIDSAVADGPFSVILEQVSNGVAVRMAVLYLLSGWDGRNDEALVEGR